MDLEKWRRLIAAGDTVNVLGELVDFSQQYVTASRNLILLTANRYANYRRNFITNHRDAKDFTIELNSINHALLEIIQIIEETEADHLHQVANPNTRIIELKKLGDEFEKCSQINNVQVRLRMKNHLSRKMSEVFLQEPGLIASFNIPERQGYICGIADKIKLLPQADDLSIVEQISLNSKKNFTKGKVVSAITEIIYSGQLMMGDNQRIEKVLDQLQTGADIPLQKNIDHVRGALNFLIQVQEEEEENPGN